MTDLPYPFLELKPCKRHGCLPELIPGTPVLNRITWMEFYREAYFRCPKCHFEELVQVNHPAIEEWNKKQE